MIVHEPLPEPVLLPHPLRHFLDRNVFGLREQEEHEEGHDEDPAGEENKDSELQMAEHREEGLGDDESEEEIDTNSHTLSGRSGFQWEGLAGNEPPEWPPRPCKCGHKSADHHHYYDRVGLMEIL